MLSRAPTHSHPLPFICSPLPSISTLFQPTLTHFQPTPIPPISTNVQPTPTHFKHTPAIVQPLSPISSPQSTYSHPIQPITYHSNPYLVPVFYVPTCFTSLCAYVPSCFTCPCAYVNNFYALYCLCLYTTSIYFTCFFMCLQVRNISLHCVFKNILVIPVFFSQCLFSAHGFSAQVFQCFHLFDLVRD